MILISIFNSDLERREFCGYFIYSIHDLFMYYTSNDKHVYMNVSDLDIRSLSGSK